MFNRFLQQIIKDNNIPIKSMNILAIPTINSRKLTPQSSPSVSSKSKKGDRVKSFKIRSPINKYTRKIKIIIKNVIGFMKKNTMFKPNVKEI